MSEPLQEWIIGRLANDATLAALCGGTTRIHDEIPAQRRFPFVVLGAVETVPEGTDTLPGRAETVTIHIWSRAPNRRQAYRISDRVGELLTQTPAVLGQMRIVTAAIIASLVQRRDGEDAYHAQLRLRALTEPV